MSGLVEAANGDPRTLAALSGDELAGVIAAAHRIQARAVWAGMAAVVEFAARRAADRAARSSRGCFGVALQAWTP